MKSSYLFAVLAVLLLLSSFNQAYCENYVEYRIEINSDNSASWSIVQVTDINETIDDWAGFQQRIFTLVEDAVNVANREMTIDPETIEMGTVISWEAEYKTTKFRFKWANMSMSEDGRLVFGDVFATPLFFTGLYGDGTLQIICPVNYSIVELSPSADIQYDDSRTLEWYRTQDFLAGKPKVGLMINPSSSGGDELMLYIFLGMVLVVVAVVAFVGFYLTQRRRSKVVPNEGIPIGGFTLESDEEKVMNFLRSSGGSLRQSRVSEQFGFSKAKTSQLLTSLEKKGVVARYKRGRDKIVNLIEQTAGGKS